MSKKNRKIRTEMRKNRSARTRDHDLTRRYLEHEGEESEESLQERISGKGDLVKKRTVVGEQVEDDAGTTILPEIDETDCRHGRVLSILGLVSIVLDEAGREFRCATRRLLKTLSTDQRHVVAVGDRVMFRPADETEGIIERVEPRRGVLSRTSRGRQHIIVTNVDQLLIVTSAAEPRIKPHLIDRFLVAAERAGTEPVICINKIDLVEPAELQPLVGVYGQLGYPLLMVSAETGLGIDRLRQVLRDRETALAGQSGVGKSSLLNAVEEGLQLRVGRVSEDTEKGRHTTTNAHLIPLEIGGYVVDTPGIRQFELWDVIPEEVAGYFRDLRPYVSHCRYPDCTHQHEDDCAVKHAVADARIDLRRYESYCKLFEGDLA